MYVRTYVRTYMQRARTPYIIRGCFASSHKNETTDASFESSNRGVDGASLSEESLGAAQLSKHLRLSRRVVFLASRAASVVALSAACVVSEVTTLNAKLRKTATIMPPNSSVRSLVTFLHVLSESVELVAPRVVSGRYDVSIRCVQMEDWSSARCAQCIVQPVVTHESSCKHASLT